ncbi:MAG TPA: lipoyl(octanoyl) transferase LipB [Bdellovibrionota bacterium]|jgi:lipoyl(octanoyl) transferase|nr:lipoyl(octanoyl) transferase LipB [Bdellovibrionota bacterium]
MSTGAFEIIRLGDVDYLRAWDLQKELLEKRINGETGDTLVACSHPAVITLGRQSQRESDPLVWSNPDVPVVEIERGGKATYHGPGQVVIYPIVYLSPNKDSQVKGGVVGLIRQMEEAMIRYLADVHGLSATRVEGATGVWIDGTRKIASIGIAVRKWVSYHGLAFNVSTGKRVWEGFNPCGFSSDVMTDLQIETGKVIDQNEVQEALLKYLGRELTQST